MSQPIPESLLIRAAELRADGAKWAAVAAELKRHEDTVRAWPRLYPDRWRTAMEEAERRVLSEASAESVHVLRGQLRSKDDKTARDAAKSLTDLTLDRTKLDRTNQSDTSNPLRTSEGVRIASFLDGDSDEELRTHADQIHENAPALRHAFVESVDPALPA